jgi:hypothetical protein
VVNVGLRANGASKVIGASVVIGFFCHTVSSCPLMRGLWPLVSIKVSVRNRYEDLSSPDPYGIDEDAVAGDVLTLHAKHVTWPECKRLTDVA